MCKYKTYIKLVPIVLLLLAGGCRKKGAVVSFTAIMETPRSDDKTYLVDDRLVYWKVGDQISAFSDLDNTTTGSGNVKGTLEQVHYDNHSNGIFTAAFDHYEPSEVLTLYPYHTDNQSEYSSSEFRNTLINLPADQEYVGDDSFAPDCYPMVAWSAVSNPFYLNFHALAGLVRIQLFSSTTDKQIERIVFEEQSGSGSDQKKINGPFYVKGYNAAEPYLVNNSDGPTATNTKVTINCGGRRIASGRGGLSTFYLSLPYVPSGGNDYTNYRLAMTVYTSDNMQCKKTLNVTVKRNTISKLPALDITEWGAGGSGDGGVATAQLVGEGTANRPFQIYTVADMVALRNAYVSGKINGLPLEAGMKFQIMRSDIRLTTSNWTEGIDDFNGELTYNGNSPDVPGITNNSYFPVFNSIASEGVVSGLTVKATSSRTVANEVYFSPFCYSNKGSILKCKLASGSTVSLTSIVSGTDRSGVGGLCVENDGLIEASSSAGSLTAVNHVCAAICLFNHSEGVITSSFATSPGALSGAEVGGLVYGNEGRIEDSYFALNVVSSSADWGCIAFRSGGSEARIANCMVMNSGIVNTTGTYGGIVNVCTGGEVNYCRNVTDLVNARGAAGMPSYGGIVCSMEGGRVLNCFCDIPGTSVSIDNGYAGGIVGVISDGEVLNSYARYNLFGGATIGTVVGDASGGLVANCYGWDDMGGTRFCGSYSGAAMDYVYNYSVSDPNLTATFSDNGSLCPLSGTVNVEGDDCDDLLTALRLWVNANGSDFMNWEAPGDPQPILDGNYMAKRGEGRLASR